MLIFIYHLTFLLFQGILFLFLFLKMINGARIEPLISAWIY